MSRAQVLEVYLREAHVGQLVQDGQRFEFRYLEAWLDHDEAQPLSVSLPLRPEPFHEEAVRPYFANLLPDAGQRRALARVLGVSEENDLSLLAEVGGDCAGAVMLLPPDTEPPADGGYQEISEQTLGRILEELPRRPYAAGWQGVRLSLAGAQPKLPMHFEDGKWFLPTGRNASSCILKPALQGLQHSVANEAFCMRLAARMGLRVPRADVVRVGGQLVYRVQRFDRAGDPPFMRLHQEDFCQALGVLPDRKYEKEGGPGLAESFALLDAHSMMPLADRRQLVKWLAFNLVAGNADAHAKNLALLYHGSAISLAPFYDLVCTAAWDELTTNLAMNIGGEARWDWVQLPHWAALAKSIGMRVSLLTEEVGWFAETMPRYAEEIADEFARELGDEAHIANIVAEMHRRSRTIEARLLK